ncbi:hypothetical protein SATMO3_11740 [Sporomusa aerivorans]
MTGDYTTVQVLMFIIAVLLVLWIIQDWRK